MTNTERKPVTDEVAAEVVDLYVNQGAKLREITDKTGVPRSTIYWILQRQGVDPQRQGTRRANPDTTESVRESMAWAMKRIEELAAENGELREQNTQLRDQVSAALGLAKPA